MYSRAHERSARGSLGPAPESTPPLKDGASATASLSLVMVFWYALSVTRLKCCGFGSISDCTQWKRLLRGRGGGAGSNWCWRRTRMRNSKTFLLTCGSDLMVACNSVVAWPLPCSYPKWSIRCLATNCAARTNLARLSRGINKPGSCQMKFLRRCVTYSMLLGMRICCCRDRDSGSDLMNEV